MMNEIRKPTVIGLYGLLGAGKTTMLAWLRSNLSTESFEFFEGSVELEKLLPGGLAEFKKLPEADKKDLRTRAIHNIKDQCIATGKTAIVTGHFIFYSELSPFQEPVITAGDLETYTHVLYLRTSPILISHRRQVDSTRRRDPVSVANLEKWQTLEIDGLRQCCSDADIVFATTDDKDVDRLPAPVPQALNDYQSAQDQNNTSTVLYSLTKMIGQKPDRGTFLVMNADRTLTPADTSELFFRKLGRSSEQLNTIFQTQGYCFRSFFDAALLYESIAEDQSFDEICDAVAHEITIHPEFLSLIEAAIRQEHVGVIIATCGLRRIWEYWLARQGLAGQVQIIGGGRLSDGYVVTDEVKGAVVKSLRQSHCKFVWAFGDSPLDLHMLSEADEAIVVTGEIELRSKSMDHALREAVQAGLKARQVLLPAHSTPRLDDVLLPQVRIDDPNMIERILRRRGLKVHTPAESVQKLLATPMRDATMVGPALREAHRHAGWYLATEALSRIIGLEEFNIPHVQDKDTAGFCLRGEEKTMIVALMRGGEPMAFGVNDAFPKAMFLHAKQADDVKPHHLLGLSTIVLVDSVVNSGKTIEEFVNAIQRLNSSIRIIVIAGVIQADAVSKGMLKEIGRSVGLDVIGLRLSENKYTGFRHTDTGNRLFNTTHLD